MSMVGGFLNTLTDTLLDVLPIAGILFGFQLFVLRRRVPNLRRVLLGFTYVLLGLVLFLQGLEQTLFPLGKLMATQLSDPAFLFAGTDAAPTVPQWRDYLWVYLFAACMGFATAIAEPSVIAVSLKANEVSAGAIGVWGLRVSVALGVATGIALGSFRIISGIPLHYFIITGYVVVIIQTVYAPRLIVPLAYDSGGVSTSTVTVPLVVALGLGLAGNVPGRSPLLDGFGMIAFACLFPIISVMGYAQISAWLARRRRPPVEENRSDF